MDTSLLGQPVELGQISRELKKLWESSGGTKTRASLVNFAVVCPGAEALEENTRLIFDFTRDHSCRALLIGREAGAQGAQAWINAHCHLPRAGATHVCCEQITLLVGGSTQRLLNALFANLDSDLPLYLWWQGELPQVADEQLWAWVDRLLFDSRDWARPAEQFRMLQGAREEAGARVILCDLNWTRTLHLRQALAQLFDHPENLLQIPRVRKMTLAHAPGHSTTAILFAGWVAAQLGWSEPQRTGQSIRFRNPEGEFVVCALEETAGSPVSRCRLVAQDASVSVVRESGAPFYRAEVRLPDGRNYQHLLPAGSDALGDLLSEEVNLGGRHRVYMKALAAAQAIL